MYFLPSLNHMNSSTNKHKERSSSTFEGMPPELQGSNEESGMKRLTVQRTSPTRYFWTWQGEPSRALWQARTRLYGLFVGQLIQQIRELMRLAWVSVRIMFMPRFFQHPRISAHVFVVFFCEQPYVYSCRSCSTNNTSSQ